MKKLFLSILFCSVFFVLSQAQDFPYGKMLKISKAELIDAGFKYNKKFNQWILQKNNGLRATANSRLHKDDYIVTIQMGETDVAGIHVQFYDDEVYHQVLTFAKDSGDFMLETNSGNLKKVAFNYGGYAFVLQLEKVGKTNRSNATAKALDKSYNIYNFIIMTDVQPVSPYLTREADKMAKRDARARKKLSPLI